MCNRDDYFQLLDRTHVALAYLETAFGFSPVLKEEPTFNLLYNQAVDALAELYQLVGKHPKTIDIE